MCEKTKSFDTPRKFLKCTGKPGVDYYPMTSALTLPPLLEVDELAKLLRLHPVTVRNKIRRGEIPAVKVGGWRIPRAYVEAILEGEQR